MNFRAKIKTNKLQYQTLVELIKERKDIATGVFVYGSEDVKKFWEHTANELNKHGQAQRDPSGWRKVWLDYKCYIKKKLAAYNLERYTTGYCKRPFFSDVERDVLNLIGKKFYSSSNEIRSTTPDDSSSKNLQTSSEVEIKVEIPEPESPSPSPSNSNDLSPINVIWEQNSTLPNFEPEILYEEYNNSTEKLLKEQLEIHKEFYKKQLNKMDDIDKCLKKTCMAIERTNSLKREKIEEIKRHNQIIENITREKNEIKLKKIELKKNKLELKRLKLSIRK